MTESIEDSFTDVWTGFLEILPQIVFATAIFFFALVVGVWVGWLARRATAVRSDDALLSRFFGRIARWATIGLGLALALRVVGLGGMAAGLLAGAGVTAFVLGFAFKDIGENFLAGIILAFNRPFGIGDTIESEEHFGEVKGLNLRYLHLKTFDGRDVYLPNATILTTPLVNYTRDGLIRQEFTVGIDYADDIESARETILRTVRAHEAVLDDDPPFVTVDRLATSTIELKVRFWADTEDYRKATLVLRGDVMARVKEALLEDGFGLPADIVELKHLGPIAVETVKG